MGTVAIISNKNKPNNGSSFFLHITSAMCPFRALCLFLLTIFAGISAWLTYWKNSRDEDDDEEADDNPLKAILWQLMPTVPAGWRREEKKRSARAPRAVSTFRKGLK